MFELTFGRVVLPPHTVPRESVQEGCKVEASALADDAALGTLLLPRRRCQDGANSLIEDVLESLLRQCRALEVSVAVQGLATASVSLRDKARSPNRSSSPNSTDVPSHSRCLLVSNRAHPPLTQLLDGVSVFTQVELGADED